MTMIAGAREQSRARYPDTEGYVERDGVKLFYEVYGDGEDTILLLPTWSIIHSRHWKAQIPYLSRHFRVVTFDGRGNGKSDRPRGVDAYIEAEFATDTLAVMDATGTASADPRRALLRRAVGHDAGRRPPRPRAGHRLHRPGGAARPGPRRACGHRSVDEDSTPTRAGRSTTGISGCATTAGFLEYFFAQMFNEPHSTKQIEDCVGWGLETDPETLADTAAAMQSVRHRGLRHRRGPRQAAPCSSSTATATGSVRTPRARRWRR